ncbi:MAG: hypothetical protein ACI3VJ_06465 [Hominicoprocola sp.]
MEKRMDLTVYLFDSTKAVRAVITRGIVQLIHKERARTLNAEIPVKYAAKPGEYIGFACVDGRFRLFAIDYADDDDNTATTIITATDAAKDELAGTVLMVAEQERAAIGTAAKEMLTAAGWTLGLDETDGRTTAVEGGLRSAWDVLAAFETDGNLFINPYYEFDGKAITGRVVDLSGKKPVYTGRLVQRGTDAENIVITRKNRPRPMIYPQGEDGLTIADAVWSKERGDPVDKPAGQLWIGVTEAVAKYPGQGQVYDVETDDPAELMAKGWEKAQESAEAGLTATATISDMEMIRGQSWKSIRLFCIVRVRPRFGQDAEAQVIEIARNYVRNDETKITLGEEPDSSANQIRKLAKTTAANVRELGKYKAQWKDMLVTVEELEEYTRTTITEAWLDLKASTESSFAQLGARLDSTDAKNDEQFRTLSQSVLTLESDLDSATAQLAASIAKIEDGELKRLSEAVLDLDANLDSATASLTARLDENEAQILLTANELGSRIDLKADVTYVQKLVADEIEAAFTGIDLSDIDSAVIQNLNVMNYANFQCNLNVNGNIGMSNHDLTASGISAQSFRYKENLMALNTQSLITDATIVAGNTSASYPVMSGGQQIGSVIIPSSWDFKPRYGKKIQYLGVSTSED